MATSHYIDDLFHYLDESERLQILKEAGIFDDRPNILKGRGGSYADLYNRMDQHRSSITPILLRTRNLSDKQIAHLVADGDVRIAQNSNRGAVKVSFSLLQTQSTKPLGGSKVLLTDLAAASAAMTEMFVVLGHATNSLGAEIASPPEVQVKSGSVEIAVGGGLFGSGIGLIVASAAGLVAAPIIGPAAGVVLAGAGIIELALGWKQKIAETEKTREETRILRIDHDEIVVSQSRRVRELDIRLKEIELEKAKLQVGAEEKETSSFAASGLVKREVVIAEAERRGLTESAANHILNRGLPTYTALRRYFGQIDIPE